MEERNNIYEEGFCVAPAHYIGNTFIEAYQTNKPWSIKMAIATGVVVLEEAQHLEVKRK